MDDRFERTRARPARALACLALAFTFLAAAPVAAATGAAAGESAERGELLFRIHCASCHGPTGVGDGPIAKQLHTRPADLTRIAAAGGPFPAERVYRSIDGRDQVIGHGSREMPIWGLSFRQDGRDDDQEAEVRGRILDLVAFLESLQPAGPDAGTDPPTRD